MKLIAGLLLIFFPALLFKQMDDVPINKIQVIGSHNSYKQAIDPSLFQLIKQADSSLARHIDYSHISLSDQLSLGLCRFERREVCASQRAGLGG